MYNEQFNIQYAQPHGSSAVPADLAPGFNLPRVDAVEDQESYTYLFELPGINPDSLNVQIDKQNLFVRAEVERSGNVKYLHEERAKGNYQRQISIPLNINQDSIEADYHDGVLEIKIPKTTT